MILIIFFKSLFILFYTLIYCFYGWKNWWFSKTRGSRANPNVVEQHLYEEKDDKDEEFDWIMEETHNPFFSEAHDDTKNMKQSLNDT